MNRERESLWRAPSSHDVTPQQQQVGYPRVIGYVAGGGYPTYPRPMHGGYVAGHPTHEESPFPGTGMGAFGPHMIPLPMHGPPPPPYGGHFGGGLPIHSPPWRAMNAPGSPPLGEGHVPLPLNPELFGGSWGNTTGGGAPAGTVITFSARPQKPFKSSRLLIRGTKSGATAIGNLIGQSFVGTDLQQGELGFIDLESLGAANAFDTWISFKQAEPGVWIRVQATLTAFPTGTDFESYTITAIGHYLH
jgi:hypothetical protein